ncbi:MAG: hypothetical protein J0I14_16895 [Propionibacteriaceae bacterium]|jgi:hypothetical protein|nr:hypothetical protein [Propionibacteriaceae bacterium]
MNRTSVSIVITSVVAAVGLILAGAAVAAADGGPPVSTPPVAPQPAPRQNGRAIQAAALAPGSTTTDFVPIAPCRIADTRHGSGANGRKFAKNVARSYAVTGTTGFEQQGGKPGGCAIPVTAKAVALNATVVSPSRKGNLRIWQAGQAEPAASFLNYGSFTMSGSGVVMLRPGTGAAITVKNYTSTTHVVLDVTGYYMPKMHGLVAPGGSIYAGSGSILSATNPSAGVYAVTFDRDITYCTPMVDTYNAGSGVYGAAYAFAGNSATVFTWYLNSTTHAEVPYSFYFYIDVVC